MKRNLLSISVYEWGFVIKIKKEKNVSLKYFLSVFQGDWALENLSPQMLFTVVNFYLFIYLWLIIIINTFI